MTIAEAVNNAIEADPDGDIWELMEDSSKSLFDRHRTMNDDGDIVGFQDGSFYSFDPNITDGDANCYFSSRADLMEAIDAHSCALSVYFLGDNEYIGTVCESGDRIDTLELTDIVDASGERVEFVSTERYDVAENSCYVEYRTGPRISYWQARPYHGTGRQLCGGWVQPEGLPVLVSGASAFGCDSLGSHAQHNRNHS